MPRRIAAHCLLSAVIRLRVSLASDRDVGFVRCRDLKLSIILRDLVVADLRPFCQCITERIISGSFVHDRRKVAVRRSIISDESFRRRRRRTVGLAVIRPAAVRRCYRYRPLADRQLAVVDRYRNLRVVLSPNNIEAVFRQSPVMPAGSSLVV